MLFARRALDSPNTCFFSQRFNIFHFGTKSDSTLTHNSLTHCVVDVTGMRTLLFIRVVFFILKGLVFD